MFKDKNTQKALGATIIILLIGFIGWYVMRDLSPKDSKEAIENTLNDGSTEALVESGDAEVKEIPVIQDLNTNSVAQPELGRAVVMPERFTVEAIEILLNNINTLIAQLKENPDSAQAWSDLANQYKIIDDFDGAVEIWKYLRLVTTDNIGISMNLGNVYHYQLKDYKKAEVVFKDIVAKNSTETDGYVGLHELYRYSYKTDTTLDIDILEEAIAAIPDSTDLRMLLASYYTEIKAYDEATEIYEEVLVMAKSAGNTNLVTIIEAAIESIK